MSTPTEQKNGLSETEKLEQQADAARARLLEVVDALDAKRHKLKEPAPSLPLPAVLLVPVGVTVVGAAAYALASRRPPKMFELRHPPFWTSVLRSVSISLVAMGLTEGAKWGIKRLAQGTSEKQP